MTTEAMSEQEQELAQELDLMLARPVAQDDEQQAAGADADAGADPALEEQTLETDAAVDEQAADVDAELEEQADVQQSAEELEPELEAAPEEAAQADQQASDAQPDSQVSALQQQVEALQQLIAQMQVGTQQEQQAAAALVSDEDFDQVLSDPKQFNALLDRVRQQAVQAAQLPQQQALVESFYKEHADLQRFKPQVGQMATVVGSEHADWTTEQVLAETAKRVRAMYGLPVPRAAAGQPAKRVVADQAGNVRPAPEPSKPVKKRSAQRPAPKAKLSGMEGDIEAMLNAVW